jgi:hypothetical protein
MQAFLGQSAIKPPGSGLIPKLCRDRKSPVIGELMIVAVTIEQNPQ